MGLDLREHPSIGRASVCVHLCASAVLIRDSSYFLLLLCDILVSLYNNISVILCHSLSLLLSLSLTLSLSRTLVI